MDVTPLIIDTDPGVDDAFAIVLAAASPEVDLRAVTTVFGNVGIEQTTSNALRLLALCDREDVAVARGAVRCSGCRVAAHDAKNSVRASRATASSPRTSAITAAFDRIDFAPPAFRSEMVTSVTVRRRSSAPRIFPATYPG